MPNLFKRIQSGLTAFKSGFNSGPWVSSNLPGNRYTSGGRSYDWNPGTNINYALLAGNLWENSACQSVLNWIIRAWPESYPCVKKLDSGGKKVVVPDHPLTMLLMNPNTFDDDTALWSATIFSYWCNGNAYWRINRTRGGAIGEFEFVPHWAIRPDRDIGSANPGPDRYILRVNNEEISLAPYDVVHYRFGKDPFNDMLGMSSWASVDREVYTDNEAVNYTASALRNRGAAWMIVTPDGPNAEFADGDQVRDKIESKTTGDNRNRVLVLDIPAKITTPPPYKDMGMNDVRRIPETRICALAGIPAMAVGLAAGLERSTFANTEQAEGAAWNTIVAVQRMMGRQLTKQVLWTPENYNYKPNTYFAGFDYSEVRALQPDTAGEWDRIGKAYDRGLMTTDRALVAMGQEKYTSAEAAEVAARTKPAVDPNAVEPKPGALPADSPTPGAGKGVEGTVARWRERSKMQSINAPA